MARTLKIKRAPVFYDPARDGVTFSLLDKFKTCREFTRNALMGWTGKYPSFALTYGGMSHFILEQAYRPLLDQGVRGMVPTTAAVLAWLDQARDIWHAENPVRSEISTQIFEESYMKNAAILPTYFRYWSSDFTSREWVGVERQFRIPWSVTAANGQTFQTFLRGKTDGVFRNPKAKKRPRAIRIMETKTRTDINEEKLVHTMPIDLQSGIYLVAASKLYGEVPAEIEMNILRKTALRQKQKESPQEYEQRIIADVKERRDWYFVRMGMTVDPADVKKSELEINQLIGDFLLWWHGLAGHYRNDRSCYLFNRPCDMLKKCAYEDTSQLFKRDRVFSELEED